MNKPQNAKKTAKNFNPNQEVCSSCFFLFFKKKKVFKTFSFSATFQVKFCSKRTVVSKVENEILNFF